MKVLRTFTVVAILAACMGLGIYMVNSHKPASDTESVTPPTAPAPEASEPAQPTQKVKVYRVEVKNNKVKLKPTVSDVKVAKGENPAETALRQMIEQGDDAKSANPIPKGTRLLGLKIKHGLATVNLSHEFRDNFTGGSEEEGLTIGAVLRTLGQFKEIKQVQFLVEGKPLDTLGHLDLSGPQDVRWVGSQFGGGN